MAIASITSWLHSADKDYFSGLMLYEQYGDNPVLLRLLKSGSTNFHFNKLLPALEALNLAVNLEPKQIVIPHIVKAEATHNAVNFENAPDKILEIRENKNLHYARARKLFEAIPHIDSKEHRLQAGLQLLEDMNYVSDAWSAIDDWKENGRVRELEQKKAEKSIAELSIAELVRKEKNIAPNLSKDRKKLKLSTDPKQQAKIAKRIQEREYELKLIKERLGQ